MTENELKNILENHQKYLRSEKGGVKADLREANLCEVDLRDSNLRDSNLREANICEADISRADLRGADLRGADLRGANIDFSCWPLWCGSLEVTLDKQQKRQLLYHVLAVCPEYRTKELLEEANNFHRVGILPKLTKGMNDER